MVRTTAPGSHAQKVSAIRRRPVRGVCLSIRGSMRSIEAHFWEQKRTGFTHHRLRFQEAGLEGGQGFRQAPLAFWFVSDRGVGSQARRRAMEIWKTGMSHPFRVHCASS